MPPLTVNVKLDPDSRTVKLEQPAMVQLEQRSILSGIPGTGGNGGSNDPAIQTSVTVFKDVKYGEGSVMTGWNFANGAAKTPESQWCYYHVSVGAGSDISQTIGRNGAMRPAPSGVTDQAERFAKCQWFNGHLG